MRQERLGLMCGETFPMLWLEGHRHGDIELNLIGRGYVVYLHHGRNQRLNAGDLAVFWAAIPHQVAERADGTIMHWLTLPLADFLAWQLPSGLVHNVMEGDMVIQADSGSMVEFDAMRFRQWQRDLVWDNEDRRHVVLLEIQARLWRMAMAGRVIVSGDAVEDKAEMVGGMAHAKAMASFMAAHYTEALTVPQIADCAGINPNYAMTIFRECFQMTIGEYLTQYRVAHAQRLLVTTQELIEAIAFEAGFTSVSRFYVAFKAACGQSPKRYRQMNGYQT